MRYKVTFKKMIAGLAASVVLFTAAAPPVVHASVLGDAVRSWVETYVAVKLFYEFAYDNWKSFFSGEYRRQFGVSKDPAANAMLDRLMVKFVDQAHARGEKIRVPYTWFVADQKEMNAFAGFSNNISVFKGTFDLFNSNEDEIAFVVGHEIAHAQGRHLLRDLDKIVAYEVAAKVFANRYDNKIWAQIVGYSAAKNLIASSVSMKHERQADDESFDRAVALGYNPGAGAAAWVKVFAKYGDYHRNVFNVIFRPNDHPLTSERIRTFAAKMTAYSGGRVTVSKNTVLIDNKAVLQCAKTGTELAEERAYLVAGTLAKAFNGGLGAVPATASDVGEVLIGKTRILVPVPGEPSAAAIAEQLNAVRGIKTPQSAAVTPAKDKLDN